MPTVTVIIPTYRPDERLIRLIRRLGKQTKKPDRLVLVNTRSDEETGVLSGAVREAGSLFHETQFLEVDREEFDHGGTRNLAAGMCSTDLIMFMTMDALPADAHLVERLTEVFEDETVACAYARQLPEPDAFPEERYGRYKSYPDADRKKTREDLETLGIRAFFSSDVCAAYRKEIFDQMGGFESPVIFNEDMIFAGRAMKEGWGIFYCARARVVHSHNYSGKTQFHRNFDLGVSQADHPELFDVVSSEKEGVSMVRETVLYLIRKGKAHRIPLFIYRCACRYAGYLLGKQYRKLPRFMILRCTMNRPYWKKIWKKQ